MNLVVNMAKLEQAGFGDILKSNVGDHKYIKREWKNNRWNYQYEEKKDRKGTPEIEIPNGEKITLGDTVSFISHGGDGDKEIQGKVLGGKGDMVQIAGEGEGHGIRYTVNVSAIKEKTLNADGTIPAAKFNANDYKNQFQDKKCVNTPQGIMYAYSLLKGLKDRNGKPIDGMEVAAQVEAKLNEQTRRMKKGDTQIRNMHDVKFDENGKFKSGVYNADRAAMHADVIKKILTPEVIKACKPKNGAKPKFVMFGGRGGSGKSWFTDKARAKKEEREVMFSGIKAAGSRDKNGNFIAEKQDFDVNANNFLILDADEIKNAIPEFQNWNAGEVHEESSDLMKMIKSKAFELGLNIIIDGTMNYNPDKPNKVRDEMLAAKDKGYSLEAHYMFAPIQDSCVNAMTRFRTEDGDYHGRLVPTNILLSMQDNEKSFDSIKDIVDDWSFRDNRGFKARLISQKGK